MGKRTTPTGVTSTERTPVGCLVVAFLLFAAPIAVFVRGGSQGNVSHAVAREGALRRLGEGPTAAQRAAGMVHVGGVIERGPSPDANPLCVVEHQHYVSGKNGGWRTDQTFASGDDVRLRASSGVVYRVGLFDERSTPSPLAFQPRSPVTPQTSDLALYALRYPEVARAGRFVNDCARDGEQVFIEACRSPGDPALLLPCADGRMTVTWGDRGPQRRVDEIANEAASSAAFGAAIALAILWALWALVTANPQSDGIARWAGRETDYGYNKLGEALTAAFVFYLCVGAAIGIYRGMAASRGTGAEVSFFGHWVLWLIVSLVLVTAFFAWRQGRALSAALALIERTPTAKLAAVTQGVVELAVRSSEDCDGVTPLVSKTRVALASARVFAVTGAGKKRRSWPVRYGVAPTHVPVRDESGEGLLHTAHVSLDIDARVETIDFGTFERQYAPKLAEVFGGSPADWIDRRASRFDLQEGTVPFGTHLYVFGEAQRVVPGKGVDYRHAGTMPEVGGTEEKPLFVHAGTERSARDALRFEARVAPLLGALGFALAAALWGFDLWLLSR